MTSTCCFHLSFFCWIEFYFSLESASKKQSRTAMNQLKYLRDNCKNARCCVSFKLAPVEWDGLPISLCSEPARFEVNALSLSRNVESYSWKLEVCTEHVVGNKRYNMSLKQYCSPENRLLTGRASVRLEADFIEHREFVFMLFTEVQFRNRKDVKKIQSCLQLKPR